MSGVLYISYDGMLEPLGQSQVLAYLKKLAVDRSIHLISFEKKADWEQADRRDALATEIADAGIRWHPLRYHKTPSALATAYDIAAGSALAVRLARRHGLTIVHARSYVAATMALAVKRSTGAKFLFDMRGFWADERVDGGLWPASSYLYRLTKRLERSFLLAADHVVSLTHAGEAEIRRFPYLRDKQPSISVIPTCADLDRFSNGDRAAPDPFVLGYVGSVGTWYLLDEMLRFYRALAVEKPEARLLIVNRNEQSMIRARVHALGIDPAKVELVAAEHRDVPALIRRMSAGMALIKPVYSKIPSAPTKLAEYLGCGVPCLGNIGVGDMEGILERREVGVALRGFSDDELRTGARLLIALVQDESLASRCRATATELFSLEGGVAGYQAIYDRLEAGRCR